MRRRNLIYSCLDHPLDSGSNRRASAYGVNVGGSVTADTKAVKARKDAISDVPAFSVEVTVIERDSNLISREDEDVYADP
jgi:hypothetical protein